MPRLNSFAGSGIIGGIARDTGIVDNFLGYIPQLGTYDARSFDISGDNLALWKKGSASLELYTGLTTGNNLSGSVYSAQDTETAATAGVDTQGWYQLAMNSNYVYYSAPLANSNNGRLYIWEWDSTRFGPSNATTGPTQNTAYLSSNNFGFYKIVAIDFADQLWSQDGITGHRNQLDSFRRTISPAGVNRLIRTTDPTLPSTRGMSSLLDADYENRSWHIVGHTSGTIATMGIYQVSSTGGTQVATGFSVGGDSAEVWRHTRMTKVVSSNGVALDTPVYLAMGSGSNAGLQIRRFTPSASSLTVTKLIELSGTDWNTDGGIACHNDIVVVNGKVYRWQNLDSTPTLVEIDNLLDKAGVPNTVGLTRMNSNIIAMGASNSIYIFENVY